MDKDAAYLKASSPYYAVCLTAEQRKQLNAGFVYADMMLNQRGDLPPPTSADELRESRASPAA